MAFSRETEFNPRRNESKEQIVTRRGVVAILAHRDPQTQEASIFMVKHNANPTKGIEDGDLGLPSETIEPGEEPVKTMERLFAEEVGINPPLLIQEGHEYFPLDLIAPLKDGQTQKQLIQADVFVFWLDSTTSFIDAHPADTNEIRGGLFLPVKPLLESLNWKRRKDLDPLWFLQPAVKLEFLSPNGGYQPATLSGVAPLFRPTQ